MRLRPRLTEIGPRFVRGDANSDGRIDVSAAVCIFDYLFRGGPEPACFDAADANDAEPDAVDSSDGIYLLRWLFLKGPAPPAPRPSQPNYHAGDCGIDPTEDALPDCSAPAVCQT